MRQLEPSSQGEPVEICDSHSCSVPMACWGGTPIVVIPRRPRLKEQPASNNACCCAETEKRALEGLALTGKCFGLERMLLIAQWPELVTRPHPRIAQESQTCTYPVPRKRAMCWRGPLITPEVGMEVRSLRDGI